MKFLWGKPTEAFPMFYFKIVNVHKKGVCILEF